MYRLNMCAEITSTRRHLHVYRYVCRCVCVCVCTYVYAYVCLTSELGRYLCMCRLACLRQCTHVGHNGAERLRSHESALLRSRTVNQQILNTPG